MKYCRSLCTGSMLAALLLPAVGCGGGKAEGETTVPKERVVIVEVEDVTKGMVEDWVDLPGMIEPFRTVTVSAEVGGVLEDLGAEEGDEVTRGQRLAVIDRENLEIKERFVGRAAAGRHWPLVWDLGANTGNFSRIAAEHADPCRRGLIVSARDADDQGRVRRLVTPFPCDHIGAGAADHVDDLQCRISRLVGDGGDAAVVR